MSIPFIDLKAQFNTLEHEIREGIDRVLSHGKFVMGPEVAELEQALSDFAGVKYALTCSSGTDALLMPLMAWEIGAGDAVFTTPFTFIATAEVVSLLGATPVFVDIDERTFNIDPVELEKTVLRIRKEGNYQPKAVIPVDLFGLPADHQAIEDIARKHDLKVLDDAAQAFGAKYNGRRLGSFGNACSTSFFPAKPLGCYGDGGAVLTNDDKLADSIKSIRVHGQGSNKYDNVRIGINGRLDTIQAAILLPKLRVLAEELTKRQIVADEYSRSLTGIVEVPRVPENCTSAWAQYSILCDQRDSLRKFLNESGVPTAVYYEKPLHLQSAFKALGYRPGDLGVSESVSERVLSLPMHAYMNPDDQSKVTGAVRKHYESRS